MSKIIITFIAAISIACTFISCAENHAAESKKQVSAREEKKTEAGPVAVDGPSIASIETKDYVVKLHKVFEYRPEPDAVLANMTPKKGYRFIYLDMSLKNVGTSVVDGGFIFIALKVTDANGIEYKKPATALAGYFSAHPESDNQAEYNALWNKFQPGEFHRQIIFAVEVPVETNEFKLSLPVDNKRKEWNSLTFRI